MEKENEFKKELGLWTLTFLAIGAILGPAIAYIPAYVLADSGPSGLLSWLAAFIMLIPVALVYVELGTMWPKAGGIAYYPYRSNGALVGALNGWAGFIGYALIMPASLTATIEYISYYYPPLYANGVLTTLGVIVAIVLSIIVFLVDIRHVGLLGNVNNVLTIFKALAFMIPILALLAYFHPINLNNPSLGGFSPFGSVGFFSAITATIFAYLGFREPINYAEEAKDPAKSIPRAIVLALIIVMIYYFLESLAFVGVVDRGIVSSSSAWSSILNLPYPYATAVQAVHMPASTVFFIPLVILAAIVAAYTDALIYFGGAIRVGAALSRYDKLLPGIFGKLNAQGIPFYSAVLAFILGLIYIVLFPSFASVFSLFTDAVLLSYAPSAISLLVFRKVYPDEKRIYRLPVANILAPIAFIVSILLIYWSGWTAVEVSVIVNLIGLILLVFYHRYEKITKADIYGGLWLPIFMVILMIVSYFGSTNLNIIPSPWDTVLVAVLSAIFYYIGYVSGVRYHRAKQVIVQ